MGFAKVILLSPRKWEVKPGNLDDRTASRFTLDLRMTAMPSPDY